jgi:hypothetical protein
MNTSDTYARLCVSEYSCRNRLCTPEALPGVLRTGPNSASFPEQLPRLEKGGETTIHSQSTESIQMDQLPRSVVSLRRYNILSFEVTL